MRNHRNFWDRNAVGTTALCERTGRRMRRCMRDPAGGEKQKQCWSLPPHGADCKAHRKRAAHIEATDASAEMILEAKRDNQSAKLHFSVQDMFSPALCDKSFDVVIVSNALHMCRSGEGLDEIVGYLKDGGVSSHPPSPTQELVFRQGKGIFHEAGRISSPQQVGERGIPVFLRQNGWTVRKSAVLKASFP